jgi:hypothetical protein
MVETKEPLFSAKAAQQTPDVALTTQRQLAMIKSDNFWEAAHHLARDWFLANMPDSLAAPVKSSAGRHVLHHFSVDAGWWRRRSWEKKLQVVWQMAGGAPTKLSAAEFARFVTQLDDIKAALAKGTLRLKTYDRAHQPEA